MDKEFLGRCSEHFNRYNFNQSKNNITDSPSISSSPQSNRLQAICCYLKACLPANTFSAIDKRVIFKLGAFYLHIGS